MAVIILSFIVVQIMSLSFNAPQVQIMREVTPSRQKETSFFVLLSTFRTLASPKFLDKPSEISFES